MAINADLHLGNVRASVGGVVVSTADPSVPIVIAKTKSYDFSITNNQTTFVLPELLKFPSDSQLYLNGVKQKYLEDYNINGLILNWFGVPMLSFFDLTIVYEV
jgi:hypothetical protein